MMTLLFVLKVFHVTVASVWIGGGVTAPGDVRRTLGLGPLHTAELLPRLRAVAKLMNLSALLTFLSGLALVFAAGGFARVPHRIHLGILLALLAVVVGRWMIRPAIGQIAQAAREPTTSEQASRVAARFAAAVNVEHLLRLAVLILMIYPFSF